MKRFYLALCCTVLSWGILLAQDTETAADSNKIWTLSGSANFNFSNVQLSNWAGGGDNTLALGSVFDLSAVRETDKSKWTNTFNLAYGIARVGGDGNLFRKTDDQLILGSAYNYKLSPRWSLATGAELRTQVAPGYTFTTNADGNEVRDQVQSEFFAPAFLNLNLGLNYSIKHFSVTISPISNKLTFVLDDSLSDAGAFGVDPGDKIRSEIGATVNAATEFELFKNVSFKSGLLLFMNYETPDLIDVDWTTLLVFKVNKYITTSFGTRLIYDHDVRVTQDDGTQKLGIQYKQSLNVNVGLKF